MAVAYGGTIIGWMILFFHMIHRWDPDYGLRMDERIRGCLILCGFLGGSWMEAFLKGQGCAGRFSYTVLIAYLLVASVTDLQTKQVHDVFPAFTAVIRVCALALEGEWGWVRPWLLVAAVQLLVFRKLYGRGDGYAFLVCALFEEGLRGSFDGLTFSLVHMGTALLFLAVVQVRRGNLDGRGNLRVPVPFLPYIAAAWLFLPCLRLNRLFPAH